MHQEKTGRLLGEEKLKAENELLLAKVRELEGRLEAAAAHAGADGAARDRFISTLVHELRTPLAAMMLWIKLLEETNEPDRARWREGLEAIRTCAEEQQQLIDGLLVSSRVAAGKLPASVPAGSSTTQ